MIIETFENQEEGYSVVVREENRVAIPNGKLYLVSIYRPGQERRHDDEVSYADKYLALGRARKLAKIPRASCSCLRSTE